MIVQLAGLPGTGKSTLAAELVHRLAGHALLLDKDHVRHALFGPQHTLYTREQDDFCVHTMFRAAAWHLHRTPGAHPAANRNIELYQRLHANAEPIPDPKLRLNTEAPLFECADKTLSYLHHRLPTDPA
ncbi:MAG: AAA family ATPase [Pseudonocardiaceae bacterium]